MRPALILPGAAIGFAAVVILGPGNAGPALGARVLVAPRVTDAVRSARLVLVHRLDGAEAPAGGVEVSVEAGEARAHGRTSADGVLEVALEPPAAPGATLVARAGDALVASGALEIPTAGAPTTQLATSPGRVEGALSVMLGPVRGQLVPPFEEQVAVRVLAGAEPAAARVVIELTGASPARVELDVGPEGAQTFSVRADALRVDVEARATAADGRTGAFVGSLDTVPGGLWLDPAAPEGQLRVAAPAPRPFAYLSLWDERGRAAGLVVPLADDGRGFHRGEAALPADLAGRRVVAVAAGDTEERGPSTIAWPLSPPAGLASAPRLVRAIDGVGAAEAAERARARGARRAAVAVAAVCGALSILFLLREGRAAQRALAAHLASAAEGGSSEEREGARAVAASASRSGSATATMLGALVALAFGVIAALVTVR